MVIVGMGVALPAPPPSAEGVAVSPLPQGVGCWECVVTIYLIRRPPIHERRRRDGIKHCRCDTSIFPNLSMTFFESLNSPRL